MKLVRLDVLRVIEEHLKLRNWGLTARSLMTEVGELSFDSLPPAEGEKPDREDFEDSAGAKYCGKCGAKK